MNIAKNLQYLRKRDKITQEELADRLNVSRQSVSKWETGEAYPETEKLLILCDMFNVTLDELMRGDVSGSTEVITDTADKEEIKTHFQKFSKAMAFGVFLILVGVAVCIALAGYAQTLQGTAGSIVGVMSGVAVILFVAGAVFLFVLSGISHERFKLSHPVIECPLDETEGKAFSKKFGIAMACLVSGILADVAYLIVLATLIGDGIIAVPHIDGAICYVTAGFMFVLSFIIGGLVYFGIKHNIYNVSEYNKDNKPSPRKKLTDSICGAIMLGATAIYLVLGFVGHLWHPGWVIFPVCGIICGIVSTLTNRE